MKRIISLLVCLMSTFLFGGNTVQEIQLEPKVESVQLISLSAVMVLGESKVIQLTLIKDLSVYERIADSCRIMRERAIKKDKLLIVLIRNRVTMPIYEPWYLGYKYGTLHKDLRNIRQRNLRLSFDNRQRS